MATRMYFSSTVGAPVTPPTPGSEWEHVSGASSRALLQAPDSTALTTTAYTPDAADDLTDKDSFHRAFVSEPLTLQTISGNVKGQFQCLEANAGNNLTITLKIMVISNDGTTVMATLLAITRDGTEANTTLRNLTFGSTAITLYVCALGERLCVEVGLGGLCTAAGGTQGHNGSLRFGCNASSGDLPEDDTEVGTTFRPWIEFDDTITFESSQSVVPVIMAQHRQRRE